MGDLEHFVSKTELQACINIVVSDRTVSFIGETVWAFSGNELEI